MAPTKSSTAQQTVHLPYIDPAQPVWDSSPITKGLWYFALEDYLYGLDRRYRTLIEKGIALYKSSVYTVSHRHSVIRLHRLDDRTFSFDTPSPVDPVASLHAHSATEVAKIDGLLDKDGACAGAKEANLHALISFLQ